MAQEEYIYKMCAVCNGTGKMISPPSGGPAEPDCGHCDGVGKLLWGNTQKDLEGE